MSAVSDLPPFPASLKGPTLELASSHLACSVALTGVIALQAGRWWAEMYDADEEQAADGEEEETHPELSEEEGAQSTATESGDQARKRAVPVRA